jgi:SAM-dependent methyltransferase
LALLKRRDAVLVCLVCEAEVPPESVLYRTLRRCPRCGFVFAPVELSDLQAHDLYQAAYFRGGEYAGYLEDRAALQRNFRQRMTTLAHFAPDGRLYEIGAAYGFFLELARERWQVEGIDVAAEACTYARQELGLDVRCGDFLELPLEPAAYDVFCLWDTIEHLRRPDLYLEKIARCLKSGGYLALTTGDIGSWSARLQGKHWRLIHPPTHLYYFSALTLARLLGRYGFTVVHVSHPGFYRSSEAMLRWFLSRFRRPGERLYRRLQGARWLRWSIYLNLYDIMFLIAQKQGSAASKDCLPEQHSLRVA